LPLDLPRAGVTQSVISAYESGQRQPSVPALARLVDATGFELTLGLRKLPGRLRGLSGPVDLLADFPPGLSLFGLGRLENDLEAILGTRVDLIPAADLKPDVRERVESDPIAL
jgi:uncharacterized protein